MSVREGRLDWQPGALLTWGWGERRDCHHAVGLVSLSLLERLGLELGTYIFDRLYRDIYLAGRAETGPPKMTT